MNDVFCHTIASHICLVFYEMFQVKNSLIKINKYITKCLV